MSRNIRAAILLTILLLQILVMVSAFGVAQRVIELDTLTLHSLNKKHHHHDDRSIHIGDSDATEEHMHAACGLNLAVLQSSSPTSLPCPQSTSPHEAACAIWLAPTLERLLRPPIHST